MRPLASEVLLLAWGVLLAVASLAAGRGPGLFDGAAVQPVLCLAYAGALAVAVPLLRDGTAASAAAWRAARAGAPPALGLLFGAERARLSAAAPGLRAWAILAAGGLAYPTSAFATRALRGDTTLDAQLAALDLALFGGHASVALQSLVTPALTAALRLAYFSHLVLPLVALGYVALRRPPAELLKFADELVTLGLLGTFLYVLVPAVGPYRELAALYAVPLPGGPLSDWSREAIEALRVPRDAFPSLHVALSGLVLWRAFGASRGLGWALLPFVAGNWAATLYLRYHYAIDVVAGLALAPLAVALARRCAGRRTLDSEAASGLYSDEGRRGGAPGR